MPFLFPVVALALFCGDIYGDIFTHPKPEDVPALISRFKDRNVQYGAAVALGQVGKPAVPALLKVLKNSTPENCDLRLWAAFTLGRIGPDASDAVKPLIRVLGDQEPGDQGDTPGNDTLRAVAAESLGKIGPGARRSAAVLASALEDRNKRVRIRAAIALFRIKPPAKKAAPALIHALLDRDLHAHALRALKEIGKPAVPYLVRALKKNEVRMEASLALRAIDPRAAARAGVDRATALDVPALLMALADRDRASETRQLAARTMAKLEHKDIGEPIVSALIAALVDEEVRESAVEALAGIGGEATPLLCQALVSENAQVRRAAAAALARMGSGAEDSVPALIVLLKDQERQVRHQAAMALRDIGPDARESVPALIEVLKNERESENVRQAAIKALAAMGPEDREIVVKTLSEAYQADNYGVSQLAGNTLKKIDPEAAEKIGVR